MIASFDGISVKRDYALEIKCPGKKDHGTALKGSIPIKYYPQLQHQLAVCGLDFIYYYSFDGEDGVTLIVQRDDDFIKNMIDKEKQFWDHLQTLKKERENAA
jgi:predicted phage-related endonuclease